MKRILTALLVIVPVLAALGSCNFILGPDKPAAAGNGEGGTGNLVISVGGAEREIAPGGTLPGDVLAALSYELTLTGPGGSTLTRTVSGGENLNMTVIVGGWRIDAWAYQDTILAGTGSLDFTVGPGTNSVQVPMNMSGPCYEITVSNDTIHGTVRSNFTAAFPGTEIKITAEKDGDAFFIDNTLRAWTDTITAADGPGTSHSFTMPAEDVALYADFRQFARYVRAGGAGSKDGTSWENASDDLQAMMDESEIQSAGYPDYTFIVKVGAGTYRPQYKPTDDPANTQGTAVVTPAPNDRDSTFVLRKGVQVWGGYPASGGDDASRDIATNKIILSGDIGTPNDATDNVYHVVMGAGIDNTTVLDGLTISGGNANGNTGSYWYLLSGKAMERNRGGGMCHGLAGSPSSPVLINVTVSGNSASDRGGGIYSSDYSAPVLINVLISGNTGSGMGIMGHSSPILTNVTVSGNWASYNGGGIFNDNSTYSIWNSVIWGNTPDSIGIGFTVSLTITSSIVGGGIPSGVIDGGDNLDADPSFISSDPATSGSPKTGGNYRPNGGPAVNAGDSGKYPDTWAKWQSLVGASGGITTQAEYDLHIAPHLTGDLAGNTRVQGTAIDMGAYEKE